MGLVISVLVVCVGVYKFIQVFCESDKKLSYEVKGICHTDVPCDSARRVKLCRDFLSHEDIEVECRSEALKGDTGNTRKRFLVVEKDDPGKRTPSPRRFIISEDKGDTTNLREFVIAKGKPKNNPNTDRFILVDTKDEFKSVSPLPLPKQFVINQDISTLVGDHLKTVDQAIGIDLNCFSFKGKQIENLQELGDDISRSTFVVPEVGSVSPSTCLEEIYSNEPEEFHRDPSPYPNLDVQIRRGSISAEFMHNPEINMNEVDEEEYYERNKIDVILQTSNFNTTEYWSNKMLVVPPKRSSRSHSKHGSVSPVPHKCKEKSETRSKSANRNSTESTNGDLRKISSTSKINDSDFQEPSSLFISVLKKGGDEDFRNSLDGVKRGSESRRSFKKRKNRSQSSLEKHEDIQREEGKEASDNPRLIFSGEYTKAMNKDWHGQHFCCWQCDESLTGQRYVLRDDHPYCVSCYESVFANPCEKCSRTIGIDSKDLSYKDKHWHEACFLCTTCGESLVDKQFGSKGDRIYCGRCYDNQFASRCDGCSEIFRAGTKKMEYKTRQWHEKCFCCCVCKVPIGTQSFIPREQEIYCAKCYEEKFATRCIKCNKVIASGGVTYKNEPWHRECFTCTHCSKSLAGERFTSRDEKPYCAECFGELFAKRCFACNKPITGIGGTKFISFEDRHWHNDCFFCAVCRTSLVGKGFITDQDDIICPDCAKQKLL